MHEGLEGVVAAKTKLSKVDGLAGELIIAGYPLVELAPNATYEQALYLLWYGHLPTDSQLSTFSHKLEEARNLPLPTLQVLEAAARKDLPTIDALRMAVSTLSLIDPDPLDNSLEANQNRAVQLVARGPLIVGNYWRLKQGLSIQEADPSMSHAALFLHLIHGEVPDQAFVRALDTYWVAVLDHGLNASTFTARVITSTLSDMYSAVTGALGAMKGPLHGGAPGVVLDMMFDIGKPENAEMYLRKLLESGERIMGFGHRIYKIRDPRADIFEQSAKRLFEAAGDTSMYQLARTVEDIAIRLLKEYKPERNIQTNMEFYAALLLYGMGLKSEIFSAVLSIGRIGGWTAHALEQLENNRLIRPTSEYVGPHNRKWVA